MPVSGLRILRSACLGALAAALPDFLEPADSSHHRRFFHSVIALCGLGWMASRVVRMPPSEFRSDLLALLAGYGSHLAADALTPRSLPLC